MPITHLLYTELRAAQLSHKLFKLTDNSLQNSIPKGSNLSDANYDHVVRSSTAQ